MRVLIITPHYSNIGGAVRCSSDLFDRLPGRGIAVAMLAGKRRAADVSGEVDAAAGFDYVSVEVSGGVGAGGGDGCGCRCAFDSVWIGDERAAGGDGGSGGGATGVWDCGGGEGDIVDRGAFCESV